VQGRIEWDEPQDGRLPHVVVDGREITWDELGEMLMAIEVSPFRLQISDPSDEPRRLRFQSLRHKPCVQGETFGRKRPSFTTPDTAGFCDAVNANKATAKSVDHVLFHTIAAMARVLSDENMDLLKAVREQQPDSINNLAKEWSANKPSMCRVRCSPWPYRHTPGNVRAFVGGLLLTADHWHDQSGSVRRKVRIFTPEC
jgi:hypothetical protein